MSDVMTVARSVTCDPLEPGLTQTISAAIRRNATARPDYVAFIWAPGAIMTYRELVTELDRFGSDLRQAGIGRKTRVGVVVPDAQSLPIAILGVLCSAVAAPFSPHLTPPEYEDFFRALELDAVLLSDETGPAAREAARTVGLKIIEGRAVDGSFRLVVSPGSDALAWAAYDEAQPDDIAFILRTSGTTARPKLVPVTHRGRVIESSKHIRYFGVTPEDRSFAIMPVYYAQGLNATVLSPLISGGSVFCPPRGLDTDIPTAFAELKPTWYSAGPTHHRAILDQLRAHAPAPIHHSLRLLQNTAGLIPDEVKEGLEAILGIPVLDAYALTETGLITTDGIVGDRPKPGTVGRWIAPGEVGTIGSDGKLLPLGAAGELVIRGPGIMPAYLNDDEANAAAFVDGWFRTGDLGIVDDDGDITLIGRIKDLINRGGEKVSPNEVDAAIMRHDAVAEAVTFGVPHPRLGEDVAAAVVLHPGKTVSAADLTNFLAGQLARYKIPRRIHFLNALSKGETGKVRRVDLTAMFQPKTGDSAARPTTPLETDLLALWCRLLERDDLGIDDDFFEMGGDSLLLLQMVIDAEKLAQRAIPETVAFEAPTVRQFAAQIHVMDEASGPKLIPVQTGGTLTPIFFFDGDMVGRGAYVQRLAYLIDPKRPFYDLRPPRVERARLPSIEAASRRYVSMIRGVQPHGPYALGGHCNGGLLALEVARQLSEAGEAIDLVAMVEPLSMNARGAFRLWHGLLSRILGVKNGGPAAARRFTDAMSFSWRLAMWIRRKWDPSSQWMENIQPDEASGSIEETRERLQDIFLAYRRMTSAYLPVPVTAPVICLVTDAHWNSLQFAGWPWRRLLPNLEILRARGNHVSCVLDEVASVAETIRTHLPAAE